MENYTHPKDEGQRAPEDQRNTEIILLQQDRDSVGTPDNIIKMERQPNRNNVKLV